MFKPIFAAFLIYIATTAPVLAETQNQRAIGSMFTTALNMVEALRTEDAAEPASIKDIHIEHGQVFILMEEDQRPFTMIYDPIAHKIISDENSKVN